MKVTIDRFEGKYAVCEREDRRMINIERRKIPPYAREGDVLKVEGDIIEIDMLATENVKREVEELIKDLWT